MVVHYRSDDINLVIRLIEAAQGKGQDLRFVVLTPRFPVQRRGRAMAGARRASQRRCPERLTLISLGMLAHHDNRVDLLASIAEVIHPELFSFLLPVPFQAA